MKYFLVQNLCLFTTRDLFDECLSCRNGMYVVKRDGRQEMVHFDKITARLKKLSYGLSQDHCDVVLVAQKVCAGLYKGIMTSQLDELAAETAASLTASHPDYAQVVESSFVEFGK